MRTFTLTAARARFLFVRIFDANRVRRRHFEVVERFLCGGRFRFALEFDKCNVRAIWNEANVFETLETANKEAI